MLPKKRLEQDMEEGKEGENTLVEG